MGERIKLGETVQDLYSDLHGVAVARMEKLGGSSQLLVEHGLIDLRGQPLDATWIEEGRCALAAPVEA